MDSHGDIFSSGLKIDATAKMHIRSLASWAMVIVVVTIVGYVLNIVELIVGPGSEPVSVQSEGFSAAILSGEKNVVGTVITILIGLAVNYFLYKFASTVSSSISGVSQEKFSNGFRNLKIYFAITSIFMILFLLIMLIGLVALL